MNLLPNLSESDNHWFNLIQQCRTSGKTDIQWLKEHGISQGSFYYHIKQLRQKACEIPPRNVNNKSREIHEVVPLLIEDTDIREPIFSRAPIDDNTQNNEIPAVQINVKGIILSVSNKASQEIIRNTLAAIQSLC